MGRRKRLKLLEKTGLCEIVQTKPKISYFSMAGSMTTNLAPFV
jgi:hypothetical protein